MHRFVPPFTHDRSRNRNIGAHLCREPLLLRARKEAWGHQSLAPPHPRVPCNNGRFSSNPPPPDFHRKNTPLTRKHSFFVSLRFTRPLFHVCLPSDMFDLASIKEIVAPTVQQYLSRWRLGGAAAFSTIAAAGGGDVSAMPPPSSGRLPAQRQRQHHRTHSRLVANVDEHPEVAYRALEQAALVSCSRTPPRGQTVFSHHYATVLVIIVHYPSRDKIGKKGKERIKWDLYQV